MLDGVAQFTALVDPKELDDNRVFNRFGGGISRCVVLSERVRAIDLLTALANTSLRFRGVNFSYDTIGVSFLFQCCGLQYYKSKTFLDLKNQFCNQAIRFVDSFLP